MKILQQVITTILLLLSIALQAQEADNKKEKSVSEVEIKTSAQCNDCKERIEKAVAFEKGVKFVELDMDTKVLTVKYRNDKTDIDKLRTAVSKIGYDADDVEADARAYSKLPACCQKGDHDQE